MLVTEYGLQFSVCGGSDLAKLSATKANIPNGQGRACVPFPLAGFCRASSLECGNLLPLWSSATCRRRPSRDCTARFSKAASATDGCDRSQTTKALTGQRTPNSNQSANTGPSPYVYHQEIRATETLMGPNLSPSAGRLH